jgi:hypothetical protein
MSQNNTEWDLLTAVVTASNKRDFDKLYTLLSASGNIFSDAPRCVMAAMMGIELTVEHVALHHTPLAKFASCISEVDMSIQTGIRYEILKELLKNTLGPQ